MAIPDPPKAGSPFSPLWTGGWSPKTPKINNFLIPEITLRGGYTSLGQRRRAMCRGEEPNLPRFRSDPRRPPGVIRLVLPFCDRPDFSLPQSTTGHGKGKCYGGGAWRLPPGRSHERPESRLRHAAFRRWVRGPAPHPRRCACCDEEDKEERQTAALHILEVPRLDAPCQN